VIEGCGLASGTSTIPAAILFESIDTTTPGGKLVFHIFGALAEFWRNLICERTYAGLAAARARGRKGGRRKKLGEKQRAVAVDLYSQKKHTIDEICKGFQTPMGSINA
jgi:DNA invertase Pin-like site-specific DNA recombinase